MTYGCRIPPPVVEADMEHNEVEAVFARVARAAGCRTKLIVENSPAMTAWTDGRVVHVTDTLIARMPERELAAVVGHELGHIVERHIATSNSHFEKLRAALSSAFAGDSLESVIAAAVVHAVL